MRLMDWNIEHMNSWWQGGSAVPAVMRASYAGSSFAPAISDVQALAQRVGNVINAVDPDVITIQEGPGVPEMNDFFTRFVNGNWQVLRGEGGAQALVVAARLDRDVSAISVGSDTAGNIDLNQPFNADIDADLLVNQVDFARKPQVINLTAHGQQFMLINNHLKSKFVNNAQAMYNAGGEQRLAFYADALMARRRISGEAFRIRAFLDEIFVGDPAARVIVTGDLNDGPGTDFFEENFLTHSVVDRIFGTIFHPERQLTHVLLQGGSTDYTARFDDFIAGVTSDLVLDHIGISPEISLNWNWQGRVAVNEFNAQCINDPNLNQRDQNPSDHRPVVADINPANP
jgi:endonuclease/exonuclease/phosphatase family metal-dependent hydrolase